MRIAVIAPGTMGAGMAQRLRQRGADVAVTLAARSPASTKRAVGLAVKDSETALAQWADVVLSILPPGDALALAKRLAPVMGGKIYADCNAISPATISHHMKELQEAGLIEIEREGRTAKLSLRRDIWGAYLDQLGQL